MFREFGTMHRKLNPTLLVLLALTVVLAGCGKPSQQLYGRLKREYAQQDKLPDEATVIKLADEYGGEYSKHRDGVWFIDWGKDYRIGVYNLERGVRLISWQKWNKEIDEWSSISDTTFVVSN